MMLSENNSTPRSENNNPWGILICFRLPIAVDMFPRTDTLKWHSFYPLDPRWVLCVAYKKINIRKSSFRKINEMGFSYIRSKNHL